MKAQRLIKAESAPRVIVFAPAFLYTTVCVLRVGISCARARKVVRKERDSYIHVHVMHMYMCMYMHMCMYMSCMWGCFNETEGLPNTVVG